ncbi:hypothetical protein GCM10009742_78840 [Kribbella karoonensis]|uniref:Uncharacterized protein n=1 Tax=Kribbella karoonensis TaxID=324851 RepID=A0ABN2ERG7_9ACTN
MNRAARGTTAGISSGTTQTGRRRSPDGAGRRSAGSANPSDMTNSVTHSHPPQVKKPNPVTNPHPVTDLVQRRPHNGVNQRVLRGRGGGQRLTRVFTAEQPDSQVP